MFLPIKDIEEDVKQFHNMVSDKWFWKNFEQLNVLAGRDSDKLSRSTKRNMLAFLYAVSGVSTEKYSRMFNKEFKRLYRSDPPGVRHNHQSPISFMLDVYETWRKLIASGPHGRAQLWGFQNIHRPNTPRRVPHLTPLSVRYKLGYNLAGYCDITHLEEGHVFGHVYDRATATFTHVFSSETHFQVVNVVAEPDDPLHADPDQLPLGLDAGHAGDDGEVQRFARDIAWRYSAEERDERKRLAITFAEDVFIGQYNNVNSNKHGRYFVRVTGGGEGTSHPDRFTLLRNVLSPDGIGTLKLKYTLDNWNRLINGRRNRSQKKIAILSKVDVACNIKRNSKYSQATKEIKINELGLSARQVEEFDRRMNNNNNNNAGDGDDGEADDDPVVPQHVVEQLGLDADGAAEHDNSDSEELPRRNRPRRVLLLQDWDEELGGNGDGDTLRRENDDYEQQIGAEEGSVAANHFELESGREEGSVAGSEGVRDNSDPPITREISSEVRVRVSDRARQVFQGRVLNFDDDDSVDNGGDNADNDTLLQENDDYDGGIEADDDDASDGQGSRSY